MLPEPVDAVPSTQTGALCDRPCFSGNTLAWQPLSRLAHVLAQPLLQTLLS